MYPRILTRYKLFVDWVFLTRGPLKFVAVAIIHRLIGKLKLNFL